MDASHSFHPRTPSSSANPYQISVGEALAIANDAPLDIPKKEELIAFETKRRLHKALPTDATRLASACSLFSDAMVLWQRSNIDELSKLSPTNTLSGLIKELKLLESSASSLRAFGQVLPCFQSTQPVLLRTFAAHAFLRLKEAKTDLGAAYAASAIERACYGTKLMAVRAAGVGLEIGDQMQGRLGVGGESRLKPAEKGPRLRDRNRPTAEEAMERIQAKKAAMLNGVQPAPKAEEEDSGAESELTPDQIAYRDERLAQKAILDREQPSAEQRKTFALKKIIPPPFHEAAFREESIQKAMASCAGWLGSEINLMQHRKLQLSPLFLNVSIEECNEGSIDIPQKRGVRVVQAELKRHATIADALYQCLSKLAHEIKSGDCTAAMKMLSRSERELYERLVKPPKEDLPPIELA